MKQVFKISIIGSGNVAFHIAKEFHKKGIFIEYIFSRNEKDGKYLAGIVNAKYSSNFNFSNESSIYIISISDDAIEEVIKTFGDVGNKIIVHTSGIFNSDFLKTVSKNYGSFYPLQSFSKNIEIEEFNKIPILVSANNPETEIALLTLANCITNNAKKIEENQRQKIHLSAVIVNNFTNHLFTLSSKYLEKNNLEFNLLLPLIKETINKIASNKAINSQTGPAKRNDIKTIKKHIDLIKDDNLLKVYKILTNSIYDTHSNE